MKAKIQSREWFEKNAYHYPDTDTWWINDLHRKDYLENSNYETPVYIDPREIGLVIDVNKDEYEWYKWAVEKIVTKEEYPEYFL